jgi:hypothetical protein
MGAITIMVCGVVLGTAQPAHAATYFYKPGHPMAQAPGAAPCTGAWAVTGTSGMFFLTAGHCDFPGISGQAATRGYVYGTTASFGHFGTVRRNDRPPGDCAQTNNGGMDAQLIQPRANVVDAYQIVANGNADIGRTVGRLRNNELKLGSPIGKVGQKTGWTEGRIVNTATWCNGERVYLATYGSAGGDSGGPVLIHDGNGKVWAAGMHVGSMTIAGGARYAAFIAIDDLLARFGASLPVFASAQRQSPPARGGSQALPPPVEVTERFPE